jgi:hypothetical protein
MRCEDGIKFSQKEQEKYGVFIVYFEGSCGGANGWFADPQFAWFLRLKQACSAGRFNGGRKSRFTAKAASFLPGKSGV